MIIGFFESNRSFFGFRYTEAEDVEERPPHLLHPALEHRLKECDGDFRYVTGMYHSEVSYTNTYDAVAHLVRTITERFPDETVILKMGTDWYKFDETMQMVCSKPVLGK